MKLIYILSAIKKHYPEVVNQAIEDYCTEADAPEGERTGNFNIGYNSLKWGLCAINEIEPKAVVNTLRDILFEFNARKLPFQQLEMNILSFAAMYPYKSMLKKRQPIDIETLPTFSLSPDSGLRASVFIINTTEQNITAQLMKKTRADGIIFNNPVSHAAGIIFRVNSRLNLLTGFKNYLLNSLTGIEQKSFEWKTLGDDMNLIINHGNSSVTTDQIIEIIKNYNW